jgi:hypothetical protein
MHPRSSAAPQGIKAGSSSENKMSLLEIIFSFLLAALVAVCGLYSLSSISRSDLIISAARSGAFADAKMSALLEKIMEETDSHRFIIAPKIHHAGIIRFSDGKDNPVMNSIALKPANSDAISSISLSLQTAYYTLDPVPLSAAAFTACPSFGVTLNNDPAQKSFLGVSAHGIVELFGSVKLSRGGCAEFSLKPAQSMLVPVPDPALTSISLIIPIVREYTLYIDEKDQLRFLSHEGSENIENQPLFHGIRQLSLSLKQNSAGGYEILSTASAEYKPAGRKLFINHLSRMQTADFFQALVEARG